MIINEKIYQEVQNFSIKVIEQNKDEIVFDEDMKKFCDFFGITIKKNG